MSTCNLLYTTAYVLLLERLKKEGYFENFSKEDYENLVNKSVSYFETFRDNKQKFDSFNEKNPTSRGVNIISKHHFSFMDYEEEIGVREIEVIGSGVTVETAYDVIAEGEEILYPLEKAGKGNVMVEMSLEKMGVRLDYNQEEELFYLTGEDNLASEVLQDINMLFTKNTENEDYDLYRFSKENLMPAIEKYFSAVVSHNYIHAESMRGSFITFNLETLRVNFKGHINKESFSLEKITTFRDSPIIVNGDELKGAFILKDKLLRMVEDKLNEYIYEFAKNTYNSALDIDPDTPLPDKLNEEFVSIVKPTTEEAVSRLIGNIQVKRDNKIIEAFNQFQNGNIIYVNQYLGRLIGEENMEIVNRHQKSKDGINFTLNTIATKKQLWTIPMYNKHHISLSKIDFKKEELSDTLDRVKHTPITPKNVKYKINSKKKTTSLEVVDFVEENIGLAFKRNDTMNHYLIDKSFAKSNFFKLLTLDESDKRADGKFATTFRATAENAKNIIAASGTPTAGTAQDIVSQLALSGRMGSAGVAENKTQFTKQCGVYNIKSQLVAYIVFGVNNESFADTLKLFYSTFAKKESEKSEGKNIYDFMLSGIAKNIIPALIENNLAEPGVFDNMELNKEIPAINTLLKGMVKIDNDTGGALSLKSLVENTLSSSHTLIKLLPGINNPKTFVGLIQSAGDQNTSIMARETLSGKKETLIIEDLQAQKINFPKMDQQHSPYDKEMFLKYNRIGVRLGQAAINEYATDNFLYGVVDFLTQNFKCFMDNFIDSKGAKGNPLRSLTEYLNRKYDNIFTTGSLYTLFEKSTSSASDSFLNIYKDYLLLNGNLQEKKMYRNMDTTRIGVFKDMVRLFDNFLKEGISQIQDKRHYKMQLLEGETKMGKIEFIDSNFYLIESFKSMRSELSVKKLLDKVKEGYPQGFIFSAKIEVCPPEYRYLFKQADKEGYYLPYRLSFTTDQENEVLDAIASTGIEKQVFNLVKEDRTAVISSARTVGTILNFLTVIDSAFRNKEENPSAREVALVLNVPSPSSNEGVSYREVFQNLDKEVLNSAGVLIHAVPRTVLDSTVKSNIKKGYQTLLVTNYESASRGLDLSGLDEIIATGAMKKGKEMIQFLSRLYSVNRQSASIKMFHGGYDAQLTPNNKDEKGRIVDLIFQKNREQHKTPQQHEAEVSETLKILFNVPSRGEKGIALSRELLESCPAKFTFTETQTGKNSINAIDKLMVFKSFMLGANTSIDSVVGATHTLSKPRAFDASKAYEEKVKQLAYDIENGIYNKNEISNKNKTKQGKREVVEVNSTTTMSNKRNAP